MIAEKQLGQRRDNDTSTHTVYTVPTGKSVRITQITLCNTSGSAAYLRVFKSTGTTYNRNTAIIYSKLIPANDTLELSGNRYLEAAGTVGCQQGTANAISITVEGLEITL